MDVVLDRLARRLAGGGKKCADVNIETEIGKGGGDDLLPAIVAVLADLGDQDTRAAAFVVFELGDEFLYAFDGIRHSSVSHADLPSIDAGNRSDLGLMTPERFFQRKGNLAHGRLGARRVDRKRQQIAVAAGGAAGQRFERLPERL